MEPEFVDNRNGDALVAALRGHLDWLAQTYAEPVELSIVTGHFNPEGFALIAGRLERLPKVRLLLGAEPTPRPSARSANRASRVGSTLRPSRCMRPQEPRRASW